MKAVGVDRETVGQHHRGVRAICCQRSEHFSTVLNAVSASPLATGRDKNVKVANGFCLSGREISSGHLEVLNVRVVSLLAPGSTFKVER